MTDLAYFTDGGHPEERVPLYVDLADRLAAAIAANLDLLDRHREPAEAVTLDGLVCARCDGFGHDAPECPNIAPAAPSATSSSRRLPRRKPNR